MKDISKFERGQFITNFSGIIYEVMDFRVEPGKRKMITTDSICKNTETDKECIVTWNKNKFELCEPPE